MGSRMASRRQPPSTLLISYSWSGRLLRRDVLVPNVVSL